MAFIPTLFRVLRELYWQQTMAEMESEPDNESVVSESVSDVQHMCTIRSYCCKLFQELQLSLAQRRKRHERVLMHLLPRMMNCLNMSTLRVYLLSNFSITEQQSKTLHKIPEKDEAFLKLLHFLKLTDQPAKKLLEALRHMHDNGDGSDAVEKIIEDMEKLLNRKYNLSTFYPPPLHCLHALH